MFTKRLTLIIVLALAASLLLSACALIGEAPEPTDLPPTPTGPVAASISGTVWQDICLVANGQPSSGCVPTGDGRFRADGLRAESEAGLGGIVVSLGFSCPVTNPVLTAVTNPDGSFTFKSLPAATYCVALDPARPENSALRAGGWTAPTVSAGPAAASVSVAVAAGEQKLNVNFGRDSNFAGDFATSTPSVATAPVATATPTPRCVDRAAFIVDVSIPDNTPFLPGSSFVKTWRLQNMGSCAWGAGYSLVLVGGNLPATQAVIALPGAVAPGATVDLSAAFTAPSTPGVYRSEWKLRSPDGALFGVGGGNVAFWTQIVVAPPATPTLTRTPAPTATTTIVNWRGEYFRDRNLAAAPVLVRDDAALDFNWAGGAPASGLPSDNFAVRWSRSLNFAQGTYKFRALADDGVRVWIDDVLVIDDWRDGGAGEVSAEVALTQGAHSLKIEYYENLGDAVFKFGWEPVGSPAYPDWKGEYWKDLQFSGSPALVRNDRAVDFDWNQGPAAAGLPADNFSVRWSRWVTFEPGIYRFSANADDGVRVYLDGQLIIDEWHESDGARAYTAERFLTGPHAVLVEYYDRAWRAMVKVRWERLPATPTPTLTPTVTATPTATATATLTPTASATPTVTATATLTATATEPTPVEGGPQ